MLETVLAFLGLTMTDALVTAGSALVVALLVLAIYVAGFRAVARIDAAGLEKFAAAEGASVEAAAIDPGGRAALAKLTGGKLMVARAMGDNVGVRVTPAAGASVRLRKERVRITFGDIGFPALSLRIEGEPPAWLRELAKG